MATVSTRTLALKGGAPVRAAEKAWHTWPVFDDGERKALLDTLESGKWFLDKRLSTFEAEYASFQDAKYCVAVNSGTAGLEICLEALGVGPGDEVIVPPYTFVATASAAMRVGATVVFVDVNESWNIDPDLIEAAITPRTKAIMPVHFGSVIADMDRINAIAKKHGLFVIEDACHSWGSKWKGKGTGALGHGGVFSFQMSKNITAGEGGAILTDDENFADLCRAITNCGRTKGSAWYEHSVIGTNARMSEFHAALLSVQLTRLEQQTLRREKMAAILNESIGAIDGITPQPGDPRITRRGYHLYGMRIDAERFGCSREKIVEAAKAEGLPCGPGYFQPLYKQPVFTNFKGGPDYTKVHCPVTEDMCYRSVIWFPHQLLLGTEDDMQDIIDIFVKIKENASELAE
ncbi:MAG TPA: DegT/DnrJ/EryC1/StrS family aminotransferase [Candidatus Hydrogenedentes bacterium]|nr:DegT/DnrJ/EryC1/StrS family aminotransferase [Candidatus Hydrogenedentota bacterium]